MREDRLELRRQHLPGDHHRAHTTPACQNPGSYGLFSGMPLARPTATVTATATANGELQRPAAAHNPRMIGVNWGYVRPEKRKVVVQLACVANGQSRLLAALLWLPYLVPVRE
jgi:hypothetical protein